MMKKIWQSIIFVLLILAITTLQFSFISALTFPFNQFNLILIFLIFSLFFFNFRSALFVTFLGGFWLDLFSFVFFGFYLLTLFSTAILAYWISISWLTNRSLYSFLLLILAATVGYNIIAGFLFYFSRYDAGGFFLRQGSFWLALAVQSGWSELAALLLFSLAGALTRHLKPFFLEKREIL